ncbi:ComEA family DNA-binding protein [Microbacterium fluvii]|uniref:ComEA family DNA-binding protein n=1 Tax=Microbacterium fluvii TaxID=415215 RepID=A0ABW2HB18_9MICO|nr:ComEA family DNA-binding protein [Microbacterium fluvii]MCU4671893.1 ComEA family DNA-binding protein [Microbacterium fluvii]
MRRAEQAERASPRVRIGVGAAIVLAIAALAATVVVGIVRSALTPVDVVSTAVTPTVTPAPAEQLFVHVTGAVHEPGLFVLPAGSRVIDAVSAAGGLADDAAREGVNLAREVADGELLHVPAIGEEPSTAPAGTEPTDGIVDLNTADLAALDTLPRVGPAIAQRIIDWREQNGPFTSVEDLLAVPGIGEKMLASLRELVRV